MLLVYVCSLARAALAVATFRRLPTIVLLDGLSHRPFLFSRIIIIIFPFFPAQCLQESWRKPRGIDGRVRRQYRGTIPMVRIGYGSNKKTRGLLPNGFKKFLVHNVKVSVASPALFLSGMRGARALSLSFSSLSHIHIPY